MPCDHGRRRSGATRRCGSGLTPALGFDALPGGGPEARRGRGPFPQRVGSPGPSARPRPPDDRQCRSSRRPESGCTSCRMRGGCLPYGCRAARRPGNAAGPGPMRWAQVSARVGVTAKPHPVARAGHLQSPHLIGEVMACWCPRSHRAARAARPKCCPLRPSGRSQRRPRSSISPRIRS